MYTCVRNHLYEPKCEHTICEFMHDMRVHARANISSSPASQIRACIGICALSEKNIFCAAARICTRRVFSDRSIVELRFVVRSARRLERSAGCAQIGRVTRQIGEGRDVRNDRKKLCFLLPIIPQWKSASVEEMVQSKRVFALRWLKVRSDYGNAVRPKSSTHANWTFLLKSYSSLIVILQHPSLGMAHLDSRCHTRPSVLSRSLVQP